MSLKHLFILIIAGVLVLLGMAKEGFAQETDTSRVTIEQDEETDTPIRLDYQFDRSVSGGTLTEMGTYEVPSPTQYYHAPFEAQKELDQFLEKYREEIENNWYWQFLRATSPFIRLHLGIRDFNELNIVGRDNPLFQSYQSKEKRQ